MEKSIHYFENPGIENTDKVIDLVKTRKEELGIGHIVIASATGRSGVKLAEKIDNAHIVNVTHHAGFRCGDDLEVTPEYRKELEDKGVEIYAGSHALSGVGRGISNKFKGVTPVEVIAETLRLFSQGVKVCVEISIMAADGGLIPTDSEIIALGGTGTGIDTAVVLKAAHMSNFFDLRIHEIIAMPRP
ncbi:MAG: Pyruvate kinase, alpha/beta domain [Methanobacterium sp. PtaU1.Bin242]|nr:MAG: Pyruvate kinase, alpha/beta domain [Methanobacterium sp. PtaU1.Bin242]